MGAQTLTTLAAAVITFGATPVLAQNEQSAVFARAALSALLQGDRQEAIVTALHGLPSDPTEADMERFKPAHDALFRAVAARILTTDTEGAHHFAVNSAGDRAVLGWMTPEGEGTPPWALRDPRTDLHVADLVDWDVPISFIYGPGLPPVFSPDGTLVGFWAMDEGQALLFDAETGNAQPSLQAAGDRGSIGGFSPDGKRLVANAEGSIVVWDLETREKVGGPWPATADIAGWSGDGHFYVGQSERENYEVSAVTVEAFDENGAAGTVRIEATGPQYFLFPSPSGPELLVEIGDWVYLANPVEGTYRRVGYPDSTTWHFLRDGAAVGVLSVDGQVFGTDPDAYTLTVQDLEGNALEPGPRDWVIFDQFVVTPTGDRVGFSALRPHTYRAIDLPEGVALYDAVWSELPEEIKTEIDAERVER